MQTSTVTYNRMTMVMNMMVVEMMMVMRMMTMMVVMDMMRIQVMMSMRTHTMMLNILMMNLRPIRMFMTKINRMMEMLRTKRRKMFIMINYWVRRRCRG